MGKDAVEMVISILEKSQQMEYIGEPISQLEHALQCAHFARKCKGSEQIVLGCLLHDLGHLCADSDAPQMDDLGVLDHESIGAEFLSNLGFDPLIVDLVQSHVQGKRYMCFKNKSYYRQLSDASKGTLEFQGGPMSEKEAAEFENHPNFEARILVRKCDEMSKKLDLEVEDLDFYRPMLADHISQ